MKSGKRDIVSNEAVPQPSVNFSKWRKSQMEEKGGKTTQTMFLGGKTTQTMFLGGKTTQNIFGW